MSILLPAFAVAILAAGFTLSIRRRWRLRSRFPGAVREEFARRVPVVAGAVVTDSDLDQLPPIVAGYLRRCGVVDRPRVASFGATFRAAFRGGPEQPWMRGSAEQYEFFGPAVRLFWMSLRRSGIPVRVFHRFHPGGATIRARVLGLFTVADFSGEELARSETVTLLNDMFLLAPATLIDAPIEWHTMTSHMVRAVFTNAGHTVAAIAWFDQAGDLVDFESDDRWFIDGDTRRLQRWTTPVLAYRELGGRRVVAEAEARWSEGDGNEWTYARFELAGIEYNLTP